MVHRRELKLERRPAAHQSEVRALLERRKASQPIGEWSCGSVFTNPPGDHAARLIEVAGSRDFASAMPRCRTNTRFHHQSRQASAADLERLIAHVRDTVERVHGVALRPEVRIVERRKSCASATNRASCAASPTPRVRPRGGAVRRDSSEREISLLSGNAVLDALKRRAWTRTPSIRAPRRCRI